MPGSDSTYMRQYRAERADYRDYERRARRAYGKALRQLARQFPEPFRVLLNVQREAVDLPPVGVTKPGPKRKKLAA